MLLDLSTLYVMAALCSLVAGVVHLTATAGGRFDSWANWWGTGHMLFGASAIVPLLRDLDIPGLVPTSNVLATIGFVATYIGMRRFADPRAQIWPWIAIGCLFALPLAFWTDPAAMGPRIAYLNVVRSVFDTATMVLAIRVARRDNLRTGWIVAVMFAITVLMFLGRAWFAAFGHLGTALAGMHGGPAAWMGAVGVAFMMFRGFSLLTMDAERSERRLAMLAERDGLTGAGNRIAFDRARTGWRGEGAVLMIDLNRFKLLNDRHGHATGDTALRMATRVADHAIPPTGRLFRWGGDEFVCVLPGTDAMAARAIAAEIAEGFVSGMRALLGPDDLAGLSIGVATGSLAELDPLVEQADREMYAAKQAARTARNSQRSVADPAPATPLISQAQHG